MSEEFRLAIARWKIDQLRGEELPEIAGRAVEAGSDSPTLAELATMTNPTLRDAEPLLRDAMRELDIREPNRRDAGFMVATHYATQILSGALSPYEGARRIWQEVFDALDRPQELAGFVSGASEIEDFRFVRPGNPEGYDELIAKSEADIRAHAASLLGKA